MPLERDALKRRAALFSGPAVLLLPAVLRAQAATGSLDLDVHRADGGPIAGAEARLEAGRLDRAGETDERGRLFLAHLRPGAYRLRVSAPGFTTTGQRLDLGPAAYSLEVALCAVPCESAAPLFEPRVVSLEHSTTFGEEDLRQVPRPADPWSIARDVPGVVADRVNVGGSETALQSTLVTAGDAGPGASWTLDGVDVTDPAAIGSTLLFPDVDAMSEVVVRTSAVDVRVRTPGVQMGLFLRAPDDRWHGRAHLRDAPAALQSDNLPAALAGRPFLRNRTRHVREAGAEAGGPMGAGSWLWGSVARSALRQDTFTEHGESLQTTSAAAKARLGFAGGALTLLGLRAEKVHRDRDTGFSSAPEARWRQSGPTWLVSAEDEHRARGVSLLTRLSYVDAGFRLDPQGGSAQDAYEDFRGIFRGSYQTFVTRRPRLQAGIEAASARRLLGLDHALLAGAGYARSQVSTAASWPGNRVLGLERQAVFFRTFQLTGFALPTRDEYARTVQDRVEAYAQDAMRRGRWSLTAGLRLDEQRGHGLASSVAENPVFPELLPAVSYPGSSARIRWRDVLPRAGLAWDVKGDGAVRLALSYAEYGAALGAADVAFDDPIGQPPASLTYYWIDRNGDHIVERGELDTLRGPVGSGGIDPGDPGSVRSPNLIDAGLRSPRTREVAGVSEVALGPARAGLHVAWRRNVRALWRPLRGLTLADYVVRGAVTGDLFGQPFEVGYFAPASPSRIVPGNGRILTNRDGYRQDAIVADVTFEGRSLGRRLRWRGFASFTDWREYFTDPRLAIQDPTPTDLGPLQDAGPVAAHPGGLGRDDVFANARWMAGATLSAALPARLEAAANLHAREGFPIPYFEVGDSGDPTGGAKNVLIAPHLDSRRLPALVLLDARLGRRFARGRTTLTAAVDAFNLLNRSTTLQVTRDFELPSFARAREILRPRIVRLGLELRF
ncbi:MAG: hypothetical protein DMF80_11580 [Acidobacteria bacterium]|nr:MAG: hypothetical protein DMF80_11580 [Acidobacteriota bacterium]